MGSAAGDALTLSEEAVGHDPASNNRNNKPIRALPSGGWSWTSWEVSGGGESSTVIFRFLAFY